VSEETAERLLSDLPRIERDEPFTFACHPGISCFNACCADLDLLLSPYDILRLRRALGLSSRELIERHTRVERAPDNGFPLVYLRMRDDARRSCPFVSEAGCTVYEDRPGPCRYYPIGRGAGLDENGVLLEELVLVREAHCRGFEESATWTVSSWTADQGLAPYETANDRFMRLLCAWDERGQLSTDQFSLVFLALFRLDDFGAFLADKEWFASLGLEDGERRAILEDDEARLAFAHDWIEAVLLKKPVFRGITLPR
jgi:Fe-S-cluster containining protein